MRGAHATRARAARARAARARAALAATIAAAITLAAAGATASPAAAATAAPVHIVVSSAHTYTSTGVVVQPGDTIATTADGVIHFGPSSLSHVPPVGISRDRCTKIVRRSGRGATFVAPALPCWSLIGRIGTAAPFELGRAGRVTADRRGVLSLGVNDNYLPDNAGSWNVTVTVTGSGTSSPSTSKHSHKTAPLLLFGVLIVAVALAVVSLVRRRPPRVDPPAPDLRPGPAAAVPLPPPEPPPAPEPEPEPEPEPAPPAATVETTSEAGGRNASDVNIFEVEIAHGVDLRVGYNHFPEGVALHWVASQGVKATSGTFPTLGGGGTYHFATVPLDTTFTAADGPVDVDFTWSIGGVPFRYSVRRNPGT